MYVMTPEQQKIAETFTATLLEMLQRQANGEELDKRTISSEVLRECAPAAHELSEKIFEAVPGLMKGEYNQHEASLAFLMGATHIVTQTGGDLTFLIGLLVIAVDEMRAFLEANGAEVPMSHPPEKKVVN